MPHVYEDQPDARQADDIKPSRFRPRYRALSEDEKALHDDIKSKAAELEALFERARELRHPMQPLPELKPGEEMVLGVSEIEPGYFGEGMKSLELAVMWTVKGLTA